MSITTKDLVVVFKKKPVVSASAVVGLIVALFLYFRMDAPGTAEAILSDRSAQLAQLRSNVTNSAQLEGHLKDLTELNNMIAATALKPTELTQNQAIFFALEASTGVKLTNFAQAPTPVDSGKGPVSNYIAIPFSFDSTGNYLQVFKCLRWVEKNRTLSRISNVGIRGEKDGSISMNVKVDLLGLRQ